jgi:hypothetical protein
LRCSFHGLFFTELMMVFGVSPFTKPADPPALMGGSALQKVPPNARRCVGAGL